MVGIFFSLKPWILRSQSVAHLSPLTNFIKSIEREDVTPWERSCNTFTVNRKKSLNKATLAGVSLSLFLQFNEIHLWPSGFFWLVCSLFFFFLLTARTTSFLFPLLLWTDDLMQWLWVQYNSALSVNWKTKNSTLEIKRGKYVKRVH